MIKDNRRRIDITNDMCNKLRKHVNTSGMKSLCREIGVKPPTVYKYLNGTQKTLLLGTYKKINDYFNKENLVKNKDYLLLLEENLNLKKEIVFLKSNEEDFVKEIDPEELVKKQLEMISYRIVRIENKLKIQFTNEDFMKYLIKENNEEQNT